MGTKLFYFSLLVGALAAGYPVGRAITKRFAGRWPGVLLALIGGTAFLVGQAGADFDHRFRFVAIASLGLQMAGMVSVLGRKRTPHLRSVDLWSPQK